MLPHFLNRSPNPASQAQLQGTKRFLLFPPRAWTTLGIYPFLHPSHAQATANVSEHIPSLALPDLASSVQPAELAWAEKAGLYVADLGPGDMLYLPPLWFHHVVAVSAAG
jgi:hypothetical protein